MKKFVAMTLSLSICLGVLITLIFNPYLYVFTNPSHAELATPATVDTETWINGEKVDFEWRMQLVIPKPFFGGAEKIALVGKSDSKEITMIISLTPSPSYPESIVFRDSKNMAHFSAKEEQILKMISIKITSFAEKSRHMKFDGTFEVAPMVLAVEKHSWDDRALEPIRLEIRNGHMEVDSSVIYEWSSKGGDTYRL